MFLRHGDAKYVDVLERTLYNGVLAGVSLEGRHVLLPEPARVGRPLRVQPGGPHAQAVVRLLLLPDERRALHPLDARLRLRASRGDALYVNLFVASEATADVDGAHGRRSRRRPATRGTGVSAAARAGPAAAFELRVRIPGWARGRPVPSDLYRYADAAPAGLHAARQRHARDGRAPRATATPSSPRTWKPGDVVTLDLPMPVRRVLADERVADDAGKVALERGPLVYCAEGIDNGGSVLDLVVPDDAAFQRRTTGRDLLGGVTVLRGTVSSAAADDARARRRSLLRLVATADRARWPSGWLAPASSRGEPTLAMRDRPQFGFESSKRATPYCPRSTESTSLPSRSDFIARGSETFWLSAFKLINTKTCLPPPTRRLTSTPSGAGAEGRGDAALLDHPLRGATHDLLVQDAADVGDAALAVWAA